MEFTRARGGDHRAYGMLQQTAQVLAQPFQVQREVGFEGCYWKGDDALESFAKFGRQHGIRAFHTLGGIARLSFLFQSPGRKHYGEAMIKDL